MTEQWSIPVSRRIDNPAGRFAGVVTAFVDPAVLTVPFAKSEAFDSAIGILGTDGVYRARSSRGVLTLGGRVNVDLLQEHVAYTREHRQPLTSPLDGVSRLVVSVPLGRHPFFAVVATDAVSALARYRHNRDLIVGGSATICTLVLLIAMTLVVHTGRLEKSRKRSVRSEQAFRATIEGSQDAVCILRAERDGLGRLVDLTVVEGNTRMADFLGKTLEEIIGKRFSDLLQTFHTGGFLDLVNGAMQTGHSVSEMHQPVSGLMIGRWLDRRIVPLDDGIALIARDVTDKVDAEHSMARLARIDPLTQLPNRRHFEEALEEALSRAARSGKTLALLYIDLDGFKKVNDTFGHEGGDLVLIEVAERLKRAVRSTDFVCRLGGDEFTVILENAGTQIHLQETCERVVRLLSAHHLLLGTVALATPSIGAVAWSEGEAAPALCRRADEAMYEAKRAGKATFKLIAKLTDTV